MSYLLVFTEILSSWESLLHWSENASVARQLQDEMAALKGVLHKLGHLNGTFDSESTIQMSIEELKVSMNILKCVAIYLNEKKEEH